MTTVDGQYTFGRDLLWCAARDPQCDLTALRAGLFVDRFALDHKDLPGMREVEAGIEHRADGAAFEFALQAPGADQLGGGGEVGVVGLIAGCDGRREYRREIGFHHHGGDGEIGFTCRSRLH